MRDTLLALCASLAFALPGHARAQAAVAQELSLETARAAVVARARQARAALKPTLGAARTAAVARAKDIRFWRTVAVNFARGLGLSTGWGVGAVLVSVAILEGGPALMDYVKEHHPEWQKRLDEVVEEVEAKLFGPERLMPVLLAVEGTAPGPGQHPAD